MKAVIIDDEKRARISLKFLLDEYCPDVEVVAEGENLSEGVKAIRKYKPDLVLLDIEMPGHSGLELLDFFDENEIDFSIIFTTAYNEYALQAFKFSAIDYLLKPISPEQLAEAIARLAKQKQKLESFKILKENINQESFLDVTKISHIKGNGAYSEVYCNNSSKNLVSRNLKNFEEILCANNDFMRVHKSYIVNFTHVIAYNKSDGGNLELESGVSIPVSPDKLQTIMDRIQVIKRS